MAKKKDTGTAMVKWDEEFAKLAKEDAADIQVSQGKFLSFKGGRMSFNGEHIEDDELRCVIVGWTNHNAYYDPSVPYDANNPATPVCYAFGRKLKEMAPHDESPEKQCADCASCPMNQFESAKTGKGKACKNTVRLAVIAENDLENIDAAEVVYVSVPPMSLKSILLYLKKDVAEKADRPYWSVITLMKCVPDSKSQFRITFELADNVDDTDLYHPLKALSAKTMETLDFPYQVREAAAPKVSKGKSKFARK